MKSFIPKLCKFSWKYWHNTSRWQKGSMGFIRRIDFLKLLIRILKRNCTLVCYLSTEILPSLYTLHISAKGISYSCMNIMLHICILLITYLHDFQIINCNIDETVFTSCPVLNFEIIWESHITNFSASFVSTCFLLFKLRGLTCADILTLYYYAFFKFGCFTELLGAFPPQKLFVKYIAGNCRYTSSQFAFYTYYLIHSIYIQGVPARPFISLNVLQHTNIFWYFILYLTLLVFLLS